MSRKGIEEDREMINLRAKQGIGIVIILAIWDFLEFILKGIKIHDLLWVVSVLLYTLPLLLISRKRKIGIPLFFMVNAVQIGLQSYVCLSIDDQTPFPFFRLLCSICLLCMAFYICFFKSSRVNLWDKAKRWKW